MKEAIRKASILIEALPYIKDFRGKITVVKCGGKYLEDKKTIKSIIDDIVFMNLVGIRSILIHGGGTKISRKMKEKGKEAKFIEGIRKTDVESIRIVNSVLEETNKELTAMINEAGVKAVGNHAQMPIRD